MEFVASTLPISRTSFTAPSTSTSSSSFRRAAALPAAGRAAAVAVAAPEKRCVERGHRRRPEEEEEEGRQSREEERRIGRFVESQADFGLSEYDALVLTDDVATATYFERAVQARTPRSAPYSRSSCPRCPPHSRSRATPPSPCPRSARPARAGAGSTRPPRTSD